MMAIATSDPAHFSGRSGDRAAGVNCEPCNFTPSQFIMSSMMLLRGGRAQRSVRTVANFACAAPRRRKPERTCRNFAEACCRPLLMNELLQFVLFSFRRVNVLVGRTWAPARARSRLPCAALRLKPSGPPRQCWTSKQLTMQHVDWTEKHKYAKGSVVVLVTGKGFEIDTEIGWERAHELVRP
jgi:hypothetical protein